MEIVLNHVTRMAAPRICIAGVEPRSGRHVRPTTARNQLLTRRLLSVDGGFVEPGALVEIGDPTPMPGPPEIEDHRCSLPAIQLVRRLGGTEYLDLLDRVAEDSLKDIFGDDLYRANGNFAVEPGHGSASLGVLRVQRPPHLDVSYGKPTACLLDQQPRAYVKITDVRFCEADHRTPRADVLDDVNRRLSKGVDAFLMLGLARPFAKTGNLHWLQVNGVCLADRPLGERP